MRNHWADSGLTKRLEAMVYSSGILDSLTCMHPEHADILKKKIAKKYTMCRIGAELRLRNQEVQEDGSRPRRKMKCFTS